MLYYLAVFLQPHLNALNVFTYHTVRAGCAALTGFLICLVTGPKIIAWLRALKVGQHIRKEHVADLHALHQGKSGTPTMGGSLIILATLVSLFLWGSLDNRLLLAAMAILCFLGAVGFVDDFVKLRRKRNQGLSAKAKFAGQILAGVGLGVYLLYNPITDGVYLSPGDIQGWPGFVQALANYGASRAPSAGRAAWDALDPDTQRSITAAAAGARDVTRETRSDVLRQLNVFLAHGTGVSETRGDDDVERPVRPNMRLLRERRAVLERAFPEHISAILPDLNTRVEIPGLKKVLIPLGVFYVLFVTVIIVASSNAVNLTDGLDGLAIGASIMSLLAYTGIAYVVSRADWSDYLYLIYVPEASELTVFGAALLGTGLGFLWFNAHPAEVFMGDTGSLALGGAIGTMAILTKQELLLILVGGLFVIEAGSVIIQVLSFQLRGKRVFKMAPLHHHFELIGWSETKVTVRFWILALLFALMSLGTLKLR